MDYGWRLVPIIYGEHTGSATYQPPPQLTPIDIRDKAKIELLCLILPPSSKEGAEDKTNPKNWEQTTLPFVAFYYFISSLLLHQPPKEHQTSTAHNIINHRRTISTICTFTCGVAFNSDRQHLQHAPQNALDRDRDQERTRVILPCDMLRSLCPLGMQYCYTKRDDQGREKENSFWTKKLISERKHISPSSPCSVWQHSFVDFLSCILPVILGWAVMLPGYLLHTAAWIDLVRRWFEWREQ